MTSDVQMSTRVHPREDDIIPGKAEMVKPPPKTQNKLWSFLKIVLQFLGVLQILIGLINYGIWTKWAMGYTKQEQRRRYFEIFASGYALWGGLSFTISGIISIISSKIASKSLMKHCLIMNIISSLASLAGIIVINTIIIIKQECQCGYEHNGWDYKYIVDTGLVLGKITLANMEFFISTFLVALSALLFKILKEKAASAPLENPYEDLLIQTDPYDVIRPEQEEYEQYDP